MKLLSVVIATALACSLAGCGMENPVIIQSHLDLVADEPPQPATRDQESESEALFLPTIYFKYNSTVPSDEYLKLIQKTVDILNENRVSAFLISYEGHTDSTGSNLYNESVGLERAHNVRNAFVNFGLNNITHELIHSQGEYVPISANPAENRRVEIVIMLNDLNH